MIRHKLKFLMTENNIETIADLSRKTKVAKSVLHGYLQNSEPTLKNLKKICDAFCVNLDYFVEKPNVNLLFEQDFPISDKQKIIITIKTVIQED